MRSDALALKGPVNVGASVLSLSLKIRYAMLLSAYASIVRRACRGWSSSTIALAMPGAVGVLTVFSLVEYVGPTNSNPMLCLKRCADVHLAAGAVRAGWAERHSRFLVVVATLEPLHRPHEVRRQRQWLPEIVQYRGYQIVFARGLSRALR